MGFSPKFISLKYNFFKDFIFSRINISLKSDMKFPAIFTNSKFVYLSKSSGNFSIELFAIQKLVIFKGKFSIF